MAVTAKIRKKVSKENAAISFSPAIGFSMLCALSLFSGDLVFMNGESRLVMKGGRARMRAEAYSCKVNLMDLANTWSKSSGTE